MYSSRASELARSSVPSNAPLGAKLGCRSGLLGCPGALGRQVGLPRRTWAPSWAAKAHLDAILGSNLASKCLSRAPRTSKFARQYGTLATCSIIVLYALQVLLDCFWRLLLFLQSSFSVTGLAEFVPSSIACDCSYYLVQSSLIEVFYRFIVLESHF